jgi:hypothetical protein
MRKPKLQCHALAVASELPAVQAELRFYGCGDGQTRLVYQTSRGFEFAVENIYANSKLEREKYSGAD